MPDEVQRLIRKMQPKGPRSFDEQAWPIYAAIVVLGGYSIGVVLSTMRWDEPRILFNAITWIALIVVVLVAGIWAVSLLQNQLLRRTLVFSVLASLIINLSLLVIMAFTSIFNSLWKEETPKAITQRPKPEVVIPEYPLFSEDQRQRVTQEYERPVETGVAEAEKQIELTRQAVDANVQPSEMLPSPASESDAPTATAKIRRVETPAAPRRSESLGKLSRQALRTNLAISRAPMMPVQPKRSSSRSKLSSAEAQTTRPEKQQRVLASPTPMPTDVTETPRRFDAPVLSRKSDTSSPENQIASLPQLRKSLRQPRKLPRTTTPIESEPTIPKRTKIKAMEANSTLITKRTTSAPENSKRVDLQPRVATNLPRAEARVDRPESDTLSESISKATLSSRSSQSTDVESPTNTDALSDLSTPSTQPTSSSAKVARTPTESPSNATVNAPRPTEPTMKASSHALARSRMDVTPSLANVLSQSRSISRADRVSQKSTSSNTNVNSSIESIADSSSTAPTTQPSRMAFSRSSVGVAGVGDAANLDRGVAAPESPVNVASAAASRARPSQDMEQGAALSPSAPSLTRQMRASDNSPRTSLQAQPIETAMVPGATAPAAEAASSAATLERASSNASSASMTAANGTTEIDLGPTRIATDTGSGRAEGGGQPDITSGEQPRALRRSDLITGTGRIRTETTAPDVATLAAADASAGLEESSAASTDISQSTPAANAAGETGESLNVLADAVAGEIRIARAAGSRAQQNADEDAPLVAGGGTLKPGRRARTLKIQTATESKMPSLAGVESSEGARRGQPLDAQGAKPTRAAAGLLVEDEGKIGAAAGDVTLDGSPSNLSSPNFSRSNSSDGSIGENISLSRENLGTPRRNRRVSITGNSTEVELDPEEFALNVPAPGAADDLEGVDMVVASTETSQIGGGAMIVDVDVPTVEGGLGDVSAMTSGILSRQAQDDSELVSLQPARFLRRRPSVAKFTSKTSVVSPTKAFRRRAIRKGDELAGERGLPSPKTEAAIELGLVFLSRFQEPDGSWSLNNFADGRAELPDNESVAMVSDTAATGLSLLSFLGAGYHHRADRYQVQVGTALNFLVKHQKDDGDLYIDSDANSSRSAWMYSHGIATIALCEAYGMTQDPELREPAQKAIDFIVEGQHPTRGGWRYSPQYGADTSVTGWMTMAMKSGELASLAVPKSAYDRVRRWLDLAQVSDTQPYLYRYNPYAPDTSKQRHGRNATRAITAVGLLMRQYTGWRRDDRKMILGARTLTQNLPELGTSAMPRRDTYYWYYATQVMYHMGGEYWETWNQKLHPMLVDTQVKDGKLMGSWNPLTPVPDRWGAHGGRLYVTTLNLLSLEVFYRHLPIYEQSSK